MIAPQNLELFTNTLLKIMGFNNTRFGLNAAALRIFAHNYSFNPTEEEVTDRCEYLTEKGFCAEMPPAMGAMRHWKITDAGRRYLDERNL
jgi:hypothetical protein